MHAEGGSKMEGGGGFHAPDWKEKHYARWIDWGLEPPATPKMAFGSETSDTHFISKSCNSGSQQWRYTYSSPQGEVVTGIGISDVVAYLRIDQKDGGLFLTMNMRWWCTHSTQRHLPRMQFQLYGANDAALTVVDLPQDASDGNAVMNCQALAPPGFAWAVPTLRVSTPHDSWFYQVVAGELLLPDRVLPGADDHGAYC